MKDCDPALGPPCSNSEHNDQSAPIFDTAKDCCDTSLSWVDADVCTSLSGSRGPAPTSTSSSSSSAISLSSSTSSSADGTGRQPEGYSGQFFVDYRTGSCFKDAPPCPDEDFTCEKVPPPVDVYESIDECCKEGQSWVDFGFCTSRSVGDYTNGWVVDYRAEKCMKDCDPALGPPCSNSEHNDQSAPIFDTAKDCCDTSLSWVDADVCTSLSGSRGPAPTSTSSSSSSAISLSSSTSSSEDGTGRSGTFSSSSSAISLSSSTSSSADGTGRSGKYFADYNSGSCFKDAAPCAEDPVTCAEAPPPVQLYDSIADCCKRGQSWINFDFCTSRSVGEYTNGWVVSYNKVKCVKDCDPSDGPPCAAHGDGGLEIFRTAQECCHATLSWVLLEDCIAG